MAKKMISVSTEPIKNFGELLEYANLLSDTCDFLHCDVMDEKFVGRDLLSLETIKKINAHSLLMLDVHLMTMDLKNKYSDYVEAGANILTIHYESFKSERRLLKVVKQIQEKGALAGLSFKPETPFEKILELARHFDLILIMSVKPGKSGQNFLSETYEKVEKLNNFRITNNLKFLIEIDGGIVPEIAEKLFDKGADIVVSGSYVYNSDDKKAACLNLKGENY